MMLILRLLLVSIRSRFRGRLRPLETSIIRLRVLPNDLDINLHVNNGRYLTIMDLGRTDYVGRTGMMKLMIRNRWAPLVGSAAIRFIRSLDPMQVYELHTRLLCWDEKWFYIEQRFQRDGAAVAIGWVQGLFRAKAGNVSPKEVLKAVGYEGDSPAMPLTVSQWQAAMRAAREEKA